MAIPKPYFVNWKSNCSMLVAVKSIPASPFLEYFGKTAFSVNFFSLIFIFSFSYYSLNSTLKTQRSLFSKICLACSKVSASISVCLKSFSSKCLTQYSKLYIIFYMANRLIFVLRFDINY